jgi:hypothetical protein
MKCVAWSPQGLDLSISPPLGFLELDTNLCILSALLGSMPFMESFVVKAFQKDFNNIINLPMFIDPQTTFMMFSLLLCYTPRLFTTQYIFVFRYLATLCQVLIVYHD